MNEKTLATLEFPKILARLAGHASFSAGRELALALRPKNKLEGVRLGLQATTEARRLLELKPNLSLGGARDIRPLVHRASISSLLEPAELLDILGTLRSGRFLRTTILHLADQASLLAQVARRLRDCPSLEDSIARAINEAGEVADAASPTLARLRSQTRITRDRLLQQLTQMLHSPTYRPFIQEPIVTQREGRFVVPIKAEFRGQFRGLVHDQSASGATLFVEPLATVETQNHLRQLQLDERDEVQRILTSLSRSVGAEAEVLNANVETLAELDLALAKARYANSIGATEPALCCPEAPAAGDSAWADGYTHLIDARHPLLTGLVVPITVRLGPEFRILVVTGPNTGGKTVALKTVGLLTLMAQAGLHIPAAEGSRVRVYRGVYADIGDEQSIEQNLSTFSSHMSNIIQMLGEIDENCLVLLDELGAGTDPAEGSALARALLSHLLERRATVMAATHYPELKAYAHLTAGVENACVEFDLETLAPTYKLSIGLPGRSNALAIARRLGLTEAIVAAAQAHLSPAERQVEALLAEIQAQREAAAADRAAAAEALEDSRKLQQRLAEKWRRIQEERDKVLAEARAYAEAAVEAAREKLRKAAVALERAPSRDRLVEAGAELEAAQRGLEELSPPTPPPPAGEALGPQVPPGAAVWVSSLQQPGELVSPPDARGEAEVQVGSFKLRVRASDLRAAGGAVAERRLSAAAPAFPAPDRLPAPPLEVDLRGARAEEAVWRLDRYLNDAYLAGLPWVRIIHGKGTGALRQAIHQQLAHHPLVRSFQTAPPREGGEGATIATLAL